MKFKDFQAPVLFSSTFKALNLGEKNSRMRGNPEFLGWLLNFHSTSADLIFQLAD